MGANPVQLRAAIPGDVPYIMHSWLNSHRKSYHVRGVEGTVYFAEQRRIVELLMTRGTVLVACDARDPDCIFGWVCAEMIDNVLTIHFIMVKKAFQDHRVGTTLMEALLESEPETAAIVYTHETKAGRSWASKMVDATELPVGYNPYFLYRTLGAEWA